MNKSTITTRKNVRGTFKVIKNAILRLQHSGKMYIRHLSRSRRIILSIKWYLFHLKKFLQPVQIPSPELGLSFSIIAVFVV